LPPPPPHAPIAMDYLKKYAGAGSAGLPVPPWSHTAWSFLGAFTGMACIGLLDTYVVVPMAHLKLLVAAFGAMSVLLFSAIKVPVSQPFNTIAGNTLGALVGVSVVTALQAAGLADWFWLSGALSVSLTIALQELTYCVHPPGGATALIFALVVPIQQEHWMYVFAPAMLGSVVMVCVSLVINNLASDRSYPLFWSPVKKAQEHDRLPMLKVEETNEESGTEDEPSLLRVYLSKFSGAGGDPAPKPKLVETLFSFLGSFAGMCVLGLLDTYVLAPWFDLKVEVAAFGAMSVLIFSTSKAPLAQPSNAVIGNSIGGAVGVFVVSIMSFVGLQGMIWTSAALSVALTIAVQERANSVHPPGGATALLYAITPALQTMGAKFIFAPAFLGAVIMVVMGTLMNNLSPDRTYPQRWTLDDSKPPALAKS